MPRYSNREVARLFSNIGDLLEINGENRFKVLAYRKAADNIGHLGQDLYDLREAGTDLRSIEGIGQAIADKIEELFSTGKLGFWEKLTAEVPDSLVEVLAIPDVGPKLAKAMWQELDLKTVADVKAAAQQGRLQTLPRMGAKSEARILASIEALERRPSDRVHLGVAWPLAGSSRWIRQPTPPREIAAPKMYRHVDSASLSVALLGNAPRSPARCASWG